MFHCIKRQGERVYYYYYYLYGVVTFLNRGLPPPPLVPPTSLTDVGPAQARVKTLQCNGLRTN